MIILFDSVLVVVCVVLVVDVDVTPAPNHDQPCPHDNLDDHDDDLPHLTDRLLNKCEKEQTNYDVQIGDGMDIVIVGENGKKKQTISIVF